MIPVLDLHCMKFKTKLNYLHVWWVLNLHWANRDIVALNMIVRRDWRWSSTFLPEENLSVCFTYVKSQFKQAMASLALSGVCSLLVYLFIFYYSAHNGRKIHYISKWTKKQNKKQNDLHRMNCWHRCNNAKYSRYNIKQSGCCKMGLHWRVVT